MIIITNDNYDLHVLKAEICQLQLSKAMSPTFLDACLLQRSWVKLSHHLFSVKFKIETIIRIDHDESSVEIIVN